MLLASPSRGEEKALVPPVAPLTSMDVLDNRYKIETGDVLFIKIETDKQHQYDELVSASGEVKVPNFGQMKAVGMTPKALASRIKARLGNAGVSVISVLVAHSRPHPSHEEILDPGVKKTPSVILFGFVSKQGKYDLLDGQELTVSRLLQRAGGLVSERAIPKIVIVRKTPQGNKHILVNTKAALVHKRSEYDLFLRPDDVVIVE